MTSDPILSKEQVFWQWFLENEKLLLRHSHLDADREQVLDAVLEALVKVDENLAFEFGPPVPRREFIVSAGGMQASFPAVLRLQETQPKLERWSVTYFRPRREPHSEIKMGDLAINSRDIEFSILSRDTDNSIGLEIFIPCYEDTDSRYKQIAYLFLDQALGEFDVETKVFYLKFFSLSEPPKYERIPFGELPECFDELYNGLQGLSGKPS